MLACHPSPPDERRATIILTAEVRGQLEPCGCTSDPLGDAARFAALVARRPGALLVDAGRLLHESDDVPPEKREQEERKARLLDRIWTRLGRADVTDEPRVLRAGGVRVAIFAASTVAEARARLAAAPEADLGLVAALGGPDLARAIARLRGADFVLQARDVGEGRIEPEHVGPGRVVAPADRLRRVGVLEVVLRGGPLVDAGSPERARHDAAGLEARAAFLEARVAGWERARGGRDDGFVGERRAEAARLRLEARRLRERGFRPPAAGSWFSWRLVELRRALPRDAEVTAWMRGYDREVARLGRARAEREAPVPVEPGRPGYVGSEACERCHEPAFALWRDTPHGRAYETLVAVDKQYNESCAPCHVTGFRRPGGATLSARPPLRDVGCEACHGPGSLHVAESGLDDPVTVRRAVPEEVCRGCHDPEHSDTFAYEPYLRDVLAVAQARRHGANLRARLGEGRTGTELRRAAIEAARARGQEASR